MKIALLSAGAAAIVASIAVWNIQGWRYGEKIQEARAEQSEAARKAMEAMQREYQDDIARKDKALNEATARAQKNATLARDLDSDVNRVRDDLNATRLRLSYASISAVRDYAIAADELFGSCQAEYADMARKAQGHAEDVRLMKEVYTK